MATLTPADFERIEADAAHLNTKGHLSALEVVLRVLRSLDRRSSTDPDIETLQVLSTMWGRNPFDRPAPKQGLDDIGTWLEKRLVQGADADHLLIEATWLKRAIMGLGLQEYSGLGPRARGFGGQIAALRAKRAKKRGQPDTPTPAATSGTTQGVALGGPTQPAGAGVPSKAAPTAASLTLPATFGARFKDFTTAREANKRLRDDLRRGRQPSDRLIEVILEAPHPDLVGLKISVSTLRTKGWSEHFARIDKAGGRVLPFNVLVSAVQDPIVVAELTDVPR